MVFLVIIPAVPAALGNFILPMQLGAKDVAFPRLNLFSYYIYCLGALFALISLFLQRRRHGLDVLHSLLDSHEHGRDLGSLRRVHRGILVDSDGIELHRHDPQASRSGHDLVALAAVSLGALRDEHHPGSGDSGSCDHAALLMHGAHSRHRDLRSGSGRRSGSVPALLLVLLASGRLHHDSAADGHHLGAGDLLLAQADLRLQGDRLLVVRHRADRFHRVGTPHVRQRPERARELRVLADHDVRRGSDGHQGVQLGLDDVRRARSISMRRCFTCSASSSFSRSAA